MDLGLEHVSVCKSLVCVSYEDLIDEIQINTLADEVTASIKELDYLTTTMESLIDIKQAIEKYGVTESLVSIFGSNFTDSASMESETEEAKEGVLKRILQAIKDFFAKVAAYVKALFQNNDKMVARLKELSNKADTLTYPVKVPVIIHNAAIATINTIASMVRDILTSDTDPDLVSSREAEEMGYVAKQCVKKNGEISSASDLKTYIDQMIDIFDALKTFHNNFAQVESKLKIFIEKSWKEMGYNTEKATTKASMWAARKGTLIHCWNISKTVSVITKMHTNLLLSRAK